MRITNPFEGYIYLFDRPIRPFDRWNAGNIYKLVPTFLLGSNTVRVDVVSNDEIEWVSFYLNDNLLFLDFDAPYEWEMHGINILRYYPIIGKFQLIVSACNVNGKIAKDEMDLTSFIL